MTDSRAEELRVLPKKLAEKLRGVVMTLGSPKTMTMCLL